MRILPLAAALTATLLVAAGDLVADDGPSRQVPPPTTREEVQDVVFLGADRPVVLRFRIRSGGRGFRSPWDEFTLGLHRYLDGNGDGILSDAEAHRGNWNQVIQAQNPFNINMSAPAPADLESIDSRPKDGAVSVDELKGYLRTSLSFAEFGVQNDLPPDGRVQEAFGHLDLDRDGTLSAGELAEAPACLRRLDRDGDDAVGPTDLRPYANPLAARNRSFTAKIAELRPESSPFVAVAHGDPLKRLARRIAERYRASCECEAAREGGPLGREALGLGPEDFRRFDGDGDGTLDASELELFLAEPVPGLELSVALVTDGDGQATIELTRSGSGPSPLAAKARRTDTGSLVVRLGGDVLEFLACDMFRGDNRYLQVERQFRGTDSDRNGMIDKRESEKNVFMQRLFSAADRDGDDRLSEKELGAYLGLQSEALQSRVMLTVADRGRSLFEALDDDRDRRLTPRELRRAPAWGRTVDRDGDGRVDPEEIPRHFQLTVGRGNPLIRLRANLINATPMPLSPPQRADAPAWFTMMDSNGDRDVSAAEFLGPRDDFRRLDADGDGLIDATEAALAAPGPGAVAAAGSTEPTADPEVPAPAAGVSKAP